MCTKGPLYSDRRTFVCRSVMKRRFFCEEAKVADFFCIFIQRTMSRFGIITELGNGRRALGVLGGMVNRIGVDIATLNTLKRSMWNVQEHVIKCCCT